MAALITTRVSQVGYTDVTIDPQGYRQGSLNALAGITAGVKAGTTPAFGTTPPFCTEPNAPDLRILK